MPRELWEIEDDAQKAPILTQLVFGKDFVMYSDAFCNSLGCVLMQEGKVIAYALNI